MKRILAAAVLLLGVLGASAQAGTHGSKGEVSIGRSASLAKGETGDDIVVVGSSATLRGEVKGDVVVVGGLADVDGPVRGDVVAIGGARLGPSAEVRGDVVVIGDYQADPATVIQGHRTVIGAMDLRARLEPLKAFAAATLFKLRPLAPGIWWSWGLAALFLFLYVVVAGGAPAAVESCAQALRERPLTAFLAGLLGLSGLAPFAFVLTVSVAGIIVVPLLGLAALAAVLVGKASFLRAVGGKAGRLLEQPALDRPLPATFLGGLVFLGLYAVPVAGLAAWGLSLVFGFGAALLAAVAALRREKDVAGLSPAASTAEAGVPLTAGAAPAAPVELPAAEVAALPKAGFWLRLAATVIDGFTFLVIAGVTHLVSAGLGGWALYQVGMWTWKSTTLGGMIVGIKGVRLDGRPMDLTVSLVRHLASYLSALPMCLGFFWAGWDPEKQAWHDKIAGTLVVRVPKQSLMS